MKPPLAYLITDETYEAARGKLETVPLKEWPSPEIHHRALIGVMLYEMEKAERCEKRSLDVKNDA